MYIQTIYDGDTIKTRRVIPDKGMIAHLTQLHIFKDCCHEDVSVTWHFASDRDRELGKHDGIEIWRNGLHYIYTEVEEDNQFIGIDLIRDGKPVENPEPKW